MGVYFTAVNGKSPKNGLGICLSSYWVIE